MLTFTKSIHIFLEVTVLRQENKINTGKTGKKEIELSLFADNMIVHVENSREATKISIKIN